MLGLTLCALLLQPAGSLIAPHAALELRFDAPGRAPADLLTRLAATEARLRTLDAVTTVLAEAWPGAARLELRLARGAAPAAAAPRVRALLDGALPADLPPPALRWQPSVIWRRLALPRGGPGAAARAAGLAARLATFAGVTEITTCGPETTRVLTVDAEALAARGLTLSQLTAALGPGPLTPPLDQLLSPTTRLTDVAALATQAPCRCEVDGAEASCLTVWGHGGPPLRLDEAHGDARRLPDGWHTLRANLADPAAGARALAALGQGPRWVQRTDHQLTLSAPAQALEDLAATLQALPGVAVPPPRRAGEAAWTLWVLGPSPAREATAARLGATLAALPGVRIARRSPALERPELRLELRLAGREAGLTPAALQAIQAALTTGLPRPHPGGPLWLRLSAAGPPGALPLALPDGSVRPLDAVARRITAPAPALLLRRDGLPASRIWLRGGDGPALRAALAAAPLPAGILVTLDPDP